MRTGSVALREHRLRLQLTQEEVAERIGGGMDATAVSRHERGIVMPSPHYRRLYARLYGVPAAVLWRVDDPVLLASWDHAGTVEVAAAVGGDVVQRRDFLLASGVALGGLAHHWLIEEPGRVAASAAGDRITPELTGRMPAMIADLRRMDDVHSPAVVRPLAERQVSWVVGMLRNGSYTEATGRELHRSLAEFSQIAGYLSYDLGDQVSAQRWYVAALRAAHTAGDSDFGANVLGCMAAQAVNGGRPAEAITLSDSGLAGLPDRTASKSAALLWGWKARAYAALGDHPATLRAIDTASGAFDRASGAGPSWLYWLGAADVTKRAGDALLTAGLYERAEDMLNRDTAADRHLGDQQMQLARLGTAQLHNGNLEAAVASGHGALDLATRRPSPRAATLIRDLARATAAHPTPATRDFADRTRDLLAA